MIQNPNASCLTLKHKCYFINIKNTQTKEIQTNFLQNIMIFLTSQTIIHPVEKQRKFKPQMNDKHFQLGKKIFRQPEKRDFLNHMKTT